MEGRHCASQGSSHEVSRAILTQTQVVLLFMLFGICTAHRITGCCCCCRHRRSLPSTQTRSPSQERSRKPATAQRRLLSRPPRSHRSPTRSVPRSGIHHQQLRQSGLALYGMEEGTPRRGEITPQGLPRGRRPKEQSRQSAPALRGALQRSTRSRGSTVSGLSRRSASEE